MEALHRKVTCKPAIVANLFHYLQFHANLTVKLILQTLLNELAVTRFIKQRHKRPSVID